ncbi:WecB/TagA/CpsF family glycosyltransferase [Candidatus Amarolinea aalborgensis]|jgi:N-acetylglucosaminyldiphosphoundecaprenol N-acetyl-beta-D-mannosaminyltransferase|uniref:WecB/TagA/CpsF family glycosyltransferase n=1 Tax=Candidatus Amarolinea aalborgensis TaxID=2249329 RepID=UPI003BF95806
MDSIERLNVLSVGISMIDMENALALMEHWIRTRQRAYVCVCTVHTVMECQNDHRLRTMVNHADLATPDGMPLVWLGRWAGYRHVNRVYGPDLMQAFAQRSAQRGYSHFFYGGAPGVPEALAARLSRDNPGLRVVGTFSPPFTPPTPERELEEIALINATQPDVVWVALGTPKQDRWLSEHRDQLNAPVLVAVGAAFNLLSGRLRQAPLWMQRSGLEWCWRLLQEPRRLWRRYLLFNPLFIWNLMLQKTGLKHFDPLPERQPRAIS